jgi:hypothetical protein
VERWSKALAWKVSNIPKGVREFDRPPARFGDGGAERERGMSGAAANTKSRERFWTFEQIEIYGEVAERSKAHAWKVCNT